MKMTAEDRLAWLKSLAVGDEVSINDEAIATISEIKRGCFAVDGRQYSRNGYHSDDWNPREMLPVTAELRAKLAEKRKRDWLLSELFRLKMRAMPTTVLEAMLAASKGGGSHEPI